MIMNNISPEILSRNGLCVRLGHAYDERHTHTTNDILRWETEPTAIDKAMVRLLRINSKVYSGGNMPKLMPSEPCMPDNFFDRYFYSNTPEPRDHAYYANMIKYFS